VNQIIAKNILVVGLVRDCAHKVKNDVNKIRKSLNLFRDIYWLLIESDSSDQSIEILGELSVKIKNFRFISLGSLKINLHRKTERLAFCRNAYLKEIYENSIYNTIDYVVVADFDGLNSHITENAILSCFERDDWDVCTANQNGPYYDLWALRHEDWCPNDCWSQFGFLNNYCKDQEEILFASIFSKMIRIPTKSDWIEVDSAFGGLAIYKIDAMKKGRYQGLNEKGNEICEHVLFHKDLKQNKCRIFINPRMINAGYTEHSEKLKDRIRLRKSYKRIIRKFISEIFSK
jgi:hypothetical protein